MLMECVIAEGAKHLEATIAHVASYAKTAATCIAIKENHRRPRILEVGALSLLEKDNAGSLHIRKPRAAHKIHFRSHLTTTTNFNERTNEKTK